MNSLRTFYIVFVFLYSSFAFSQYPPPAGVPGTTAMYKDSSAFIGWASYCTIDRGFINISDTNVTYNGANRTTYGSYLYASGPADELVVSLGDRGSALLTFDSPIVNGPGPDFAVFENAFGDDFLELAFVEVSSDGQRFVRFPAVSLTQDTVQVSTFGTLDATKINNLAGKYRLTYGTPFDLQDIKDSSGIDLNHILYVRVIDVVGCLTVPFASFDSQGHKVNDPWPTPFDTGGFDLDAVGVIHNLAQGLPEEGQLSAISLFPNPVTDYLSIISPVRERINLKISDPVGRVVLTEPLTGSARINLSALNPGMYIVSFTTENGLSVSKKIIKN
ncbi:MAG: T9SS type A sorting domain-containing protein [Bacteroidota bacterium]